MKVLNNGYFTITLDGADLAKGLRSNGAEGRNSNRLIQSYGAIGMDTVLQTLPDIVVSALTEDTLVIQDDFPFPQIFTLDRHLLICNRNTVVEWNYDELVLKATVVGTGGLWEVASVDNFIYLSNGQVSLVRDPATGSYTESGPVCEAICNYNGQIICGNY